MEASRKQPFKARQMKELSPAQVVNSIYVINHSATLPLSPLSSQSLSPEERLGLYFSPSQVGQEANPGPLPFL